MRIWTGSFGSSHQPSISPERGLLGLLDFVPSVKGFFQFREVWTTISLPLMEALAAKLPVLADLLVMIGDDCFAWGMRRVGGAGRPLGE